MVYFPDAEDEGFRQALPPRARVSWAPLAGPAPRDPVASPGAGVVGGEDEGWFGVAGVRATEGPRRGPAPGEAGVRRAAAPVIMLPEGATPTAGSTP